MTDLTVETCAKAVGLLRRHPLRAGDALHFATALVVDAAVFVGSDNRLFDAARSEGLTCLNPVAHAAEDETVI